MSKFVLKNEVVDNIFYKTENIIVQRTQEGKKNKRCYLIGNGISLSINDQNIVTNHDPFMTKFVPKIQKWFSVYTFYFPFECSGLAEASKDLSVFIVELSSLYEEVFLVGHSKCGLCLYNSAQYCEAENITLITVSTPFRGTFIADKEAVEQKLRFFPLKKIYNIIFSNHNVDQDLIPDSVFLKSIQGQHIRYIHHINFVSSLKAISKCKTFTDFILYLVDKLLGVSGDGIVPLSSQKIYGVIPVYLSYSHATSLDLALKTINNEETNN